MNTKQIEKYLPLLFLFAFAFCAVIYKDRTSLKRRLVDMQHLTTAYFDLVNSNQVPDFHNMTQYLSAKRIELFNASSNAYTVYTNFISEKMDDVIVLEENASYFKDPQKHLSVISDGSIRMIKN